QSQFAFIFKTLDVLLQIIARECIRAELLTRLAEDRVAASGSILHVKNRIVLRLLGDFLKIEIQRRVGLTVKHHEADRISTHFIDNLAQRYKFPRTLRHAHGLAGAIELNQLAKKNCQLQLVVADGTRERLQALDVAAVVGTENIDQVLEAAL